MLYIYADGKLHIQKDNGVVGVDFSPNGTVEVGEVLPFPTEYEVFTHYEVMCKFNIELYGEYKFPLDRPIVEDAKVEVVEDEQVKSTKRTTRKSTK